MRESAAFPGLWLGQVESEDDRNRFPRLSRGWIPIVSLQTCKKCRRTVGAVEWTESERTMDSEGVMFFDSGPVCDECIGHAPNLSLEQARYRAKREQQ